MHQYNTQTIMKKKLLTIALALAATAAVSAQTQNPEEEYIQNNYTTLASSSGLRDRGQALRASDKMYRPQKFTDFAFEGILLDIDQQGKIDAINKEFEQKREACRKSCEANRAQCTDSTACSPDLLSIDSSADRRSQMKRDYVTAVKGVLTPEQYVTFLENIVFMPQQQAAPGFGRRGGFGHDNRLHGGHHGMRKADCPQSPDKCCKADQQTKRGK